MKIRSVERSFRILERYLEHYNLSIVVTTAPHNRRLKTIYRRYHALLTWHAYLQERTPEYFERRDDFNSFNLYLTECVSDTAQAVFLWSQGLYKPSNLILRSGIENFLRAIGLREGQAILEVESTYELARVVRETSAIQSTNVSRQQFDRLWTAYGVRCKYVHTSDAQHMSLTTAVGVFPRFDVDEASKTGDIVRVCVIAYCSLMCLMFPCYFRSFHHEDYDIVSDELPKVVRQRLGERPG
jgi:hypothetical protein